MSMYVLYIYYTYMCATIFMYASLHIITHHDKIYHATCMEMEMMLCQIIDLQAADAGVRTIGSHFFRWTHLIFARVQTAVVVLSGKVQRSTLQQTNMAMIPWPKWSLI